MCASKMHTRGGSTDTGLINPSLTRLPTMSPSWHERIHVNRYGIIGITRPHLGSPTHRKVHNRLSPYGGHFHYGILGLYYYPRCAHHSRPRRTPSPRRYSIGHTCMHDTPKRKTLLFPINVSKCHRPSIPNSLHFITTFRVSFSMGF